MAEFSVFSYHYRDAANYKAWGQLLIEGTASAADLEILRHRFESGEFFIAEQLGIPTLYADLWAFSDGVVDDDHVWHTFDEIRAATVADLSTPIFDTVESLIEKIKGVEAWNEKLSAHWGV